MRNSLSTKTEVILLGRRRAIPGGRLWLLSAAYASLAALAVGLLGSACPNTAAADDNAVVAANYVADPATESSHVKAVSYSTGTAGHKLKWLPIRPTKAEAARRPTEHTAQHVMPGSPRPLRPVGPDPFDDPFGDGQKATELLPPANLLSDEILEDAGAEPLLGGSLPPLVDEPPSGNAESSQQSEEIKVPTLDEALTAAPEIGMEPCPTPEDLKPIDKITHDISAKDGRFPRECGLGESTFQPRTWSPTTFAWTASGLCHKPLYFEQVHLERYGHSCGPYVQPLVSGAHFFLTVPILPYKMGLTPPGECLYTLGYYRPGSCAPYLVDPVPLSLRAALAEGAVWTGMAFLIP